MEEEESKTYYKRYTWCSECEKNNVKTFGSGLGAFNVKVDDARVFRWTDLIYCPTCGFKLEE